MHTIQISFSYYYKNEAIEQLNGLNLGGYELQTSKLHKPALNTGGIAWFGIILFFPFAVATGFFEEFGRDIYLQLKKRLCKLYSERRKDGSEYFTANIPTKNGLIVVHFEPENEEEFIVSLNQLAADFKTMSLSEDQNGWWDLRYDNIKCCWKAKKSDLTY